MIALPETVTLSAPAPAVRLMPYWTRAFPSQSCEGALEHDFKMTAGLGSLMICARCKSAAWLKSPLSGHA